jgi:hypothetical protein
MPRVPRVLQLAVESITRYGVEHTHTDNKLGDLREVRAFNSRALELRLFRTASGSHHSSSLVMTRVHRMS